MMDAYDEMVSSLKGDEPNANDLLAELDIAKSRIKQLEAVNLALIAERDQLKSATVDRHELQAKGEHPAPCGRTCEANAYQIAERGYLKQINDLRSANGDLKDHFDALKADYDALLKEREETLKQEPVAYSQQNGLDTSFCSLQYQREYNVPLETLKPLYDKPMPPAIPEGYVMVPVEPTKEMTDSAHAVEHCGNSEPHFAFAYKAMIAASQTGGEI